MQRVTETFSAPELVAEMDERVAAGLWPYEEAIVRRHFPDRGRVLVVGCGCGREALALAAKGYQVSAVDVADAQLERARLNARAARLSIDFHRCDGVSIPCGDDAFDVVLLWTQVLGNIEEDEDRRRLLIACRERLVAGGLLSATVHEHSFCTATWSNSDEHWLYPWGPDRLRYRLFTPWSFALLLTDAGLAFDELAVPPSQPAVLYAVARPGS